MDLDSKEDSICMPQTRALLGISRRAYSDVLRASYEMGAFGGSYEMDREVQVCLATTRSSRGMEGENA
jgi:hypothetical protein